MAGSTLGRLNIKQNGTIKRGEERERAKKTSQDEETGKKEMKRETTSDERVGQKREKERRRALHFNSAPLTHTYFTYYGYCLWW